LTISALRLKSALVLLAALPLSAQARRVEAQTPDSLVRQAIALIEANRLSMEGTSEWDRAVKTALDANPNTLTLARVTIRTLVKGAPSVAARFLSPEEFNPFLIEVTGQPHKGVGLMELLSVDEDRTRGGLVVITPVPGSPAARVLRTGDYIVRIGEHETRNFSLSQNMMFLRGDTGTAVPVTVRRGNGFLNVSLKPARILPPGTTARPLAVGKDSILYVRVGQFTEGTAAVFLAALDSARQHNYAGMVLDLRNNPGGLLGEAQQVLGGLLGPVAIGSTEGRTGVRSLLAQGNRRSTLPLAVLMNRGTASAAELVASALADTKTGVTIGERSFGKGLVNSAFPLADSSVLLIGSGRLVTAGGKQILRTGVVPMISQPGPHHGSPMRSGPHRRRTCNSLEPLRRFVDAGSRRSLRKVCADHPTIGTLRHSSEKLLEAQRCARIDSRGPPRGDPGRERGYEC
jgi:carboxyl-terminal processing protease